MEKNPEKVNSIIRAAKQRFAHYGFAKVTMEEIAADVDLGKASLYYYFPAKEDLFKDVIRSEQNEFISEIRSLIGRKIKASEKLREYVNHRLDLFHKLLNLGTLIFHSPFINNSMCRSLFTEFEKTELLLLDEIINEGKKSGEFNKDFKSRTTKVFLHILQGLLLRAMRDINDNQIEKSALTELRKEMDIVVEIFIINFKA
jgi:TetR/AcrR family transcriptional repressor of mexJK operon